MLDPLLKSLNIDPKVMLLNGILFLVLVKALDFLFWRPMTRHLEKRRADISGAYRTVEDTRREMENLRSEYQSRLARIEAEARGRIQQTVRDAQQQREVIISQARAESEKAIREAEASTAREKEEVLTAMHAHLSEVALGALGKAIGKQPDQAGRALVDEYISRS